MTPTLTVPDNASAPVTGAILENLNRVIRGKNHVVEQVLVALLGGGHLLLEDVPGVGKTTLAKALALSIAGEFHRIQFTPDLLPTDIIGGMVYAPATGVFTFRPGPIFCHILLADEINRASPRTQAALLEAMNERQVSVEGRAYPLPDPFLVIATQNPIEHQGTYPLPEAQLDRFAAKLELGYPSAEDELAMLIDQRYTHPIEALRSVLTAGAVLELQERVRSVALEPTLMRYLLEVVRATRHDPRVMLGASPRATLTLRRMCQALAVMRGRDFVTPDDVKELAVPTLAHRLGLDAKAKYSGLCPRTVIEDILATIPAPV